MKQIKETREDNLLLALLDTLGVQGKVAYFWNANFLRSRRNAPYLLLYVNRIKIWDGQGSCIDLRYTIVVSEEGMFLFFSWGKKSALEKIFVVVLFFILKDLSHFQWFVLSRNIIAKSPLSGCYKTFISKKKNSIISVFLPWWKVSSLCWNIYVYMCSGTKVVVLHTLIDMWWTSSAPIFYLQVT